MKHSIAVLSVVAVLLVAGMANASIVAVGLPQETGSWAQEFNEKGVGQFNQMAVQMLTGAGFEAPAFSAFHSTGWTNTNNNSVYAVAAKGAGYDTDMNFDLNFLGSSSSPLSFVFVAYKDEVKLEYAKAVWNGGWTITGFVLSDAPTWQTMADAAAVPEPTTIIVWSLLGLVAAGYGVWRRKRAA